jgi:Uma2 family endonuclease
MTVAMDKPKSLEAALDELELPPGFKAELIEGEIIVTPPPNREHESVLSELTRAIVLHTDFRTSAGLGLVTPHGRFIPDLTVATKEFMRSSPSEYWNDVTGVLLVAEVTSWDGTKDRGAKAIGYGAAGIPLYLLVDRAEKETVLFSEPRDGRYQNRETFEITAAVPLPPPFGFTVEGLA